MVTLILTLLAYGCPTQAVAKAFGERTIKQWWQRSGAHCESFHQYTIGQSKLDLQQVQAEEIRGKVQGVVCWMDEHSVEPLADEDYTLDPTTLALSLSTLGVTKATSATHLLVTYSFVGIFALLEFKQLLHMDVSAADMNQVEQWAALLLAVLVTEHDTLLATLNSQVDAIYSAGDFVTKQTIDNLRLLDGEPAGSGDPPKLRLRFQVSGRLEVGKQSLPAFGLIEQIISPGRTATHGSIDIAVNLANTP